MAPKSVTFRRHDHLVSVLFGELLSHSYNITFSMFLDLVFKASNSVHFLYQHQYALSPRLSNQLIWGRFVNVRGLPGRNIPLDLHMEHLNRIAKDAMRNLGSNKTQVSSITRVGRCMGTLAPLLHHFDTENDGKSSSSKYRKPAATSDIFIFVEDLMASNAFSVLKGRRMSHFKKGKDLFKVQQKELIEWMVGRLC